MRRIASVVAVVLLAITCTPGAGKAASTPEAAVRDFYATLLQAMKGGASLGERGRYDALAPAIRRDFDLSAMAHMAVGPRWAQFSSAQQQQVTEAFARYTIATYAGNFNSYSGEKLEVTGQRTTPFGTIVDTHIVRSNGSPVSIDYRMRRNGDNWQIADVYLTGTVSQVATLRSQFSAVLADQGVSGLIDTLNRKTEMLVASSSGS